MDERAGAGGYAVELVGKGEHVRAAMGACAADKTQRRVVDFTRILSRFNASNG